MDNVYIDLSERIHIPLNPLVICIQKLLVRAIFNFINVKNISPVRNRVDVSCKPE